MYLNYTSTFPYRATCPYQTLTINHLQSICSVNQWDGFYAMITLLVNPRHHFFHMLFLTLY